LFILDTLLIGGIRFVLEKVAAAADAEANDESALRELLLEAEMQRELGEITNREFAKREREILARMREIKGGRRAGALTMASRGVEVESYDETAH
jgi:hypothetical protein